MERKEEKLNERMREKRKESSNEPKRILSLAGKTENIYEYNLMVI